MIAYQIILYWNVEILTCNFNYYIFNFFAQFWMFEVNFWVLSDCFFIQSKTRIHQLSLTIIRDNFIISYCGKLHSFSTVFCVHVGEDTEQVECGGLDLVCEHESVESPFTSHSTLSFVWGEENHHRKRARIWRLSLDGFGVVLFLWSCRCWTPAVHHLWSVGKQIGGLRFSTSFNIKAASVLSNRYSLARSIDQSASSS